VGGSRWVGGGKVSEEKQRNWVRGREKIKFQKKKLRSGLIRARKRVNLVVHHPSTLAAGSRSPIRTNFAHFNRSTLKLQTKNRY
jgi:hypothetical protein